MGRGLIDKQDLWLHFRCPNCGADYPIKGPTTYEERKALVAELEKARRELLGINR